MGHPQLQVVLRQASALAGRRSESGPDAELYLRFTRDRDEAAFAELVRRHGPMVWGVCRNMLPHDADAEDAYQATFLALVRANGSIRDADRLAAWLHGVAVRVALKARRSSAHRRRREQAAAEGEASAPVPEAAWDDLLAAVHEEVQNLPDALRSAFVLCGLEGVRQPEAAARLGCSPGTLSARLTRARQKLLEGLARRGIAPAVATGALAAGAATGATAPATLVARVSELIQPAATIPPNVFYLSQGVIEMNLRTKWLAAGLLAAVGFAMTTGTALISDAAAQRPNPDRQPPTRDDRVRGEPPGRSRPDDGPRGPMGFGGTGGVMAGPAIRGWEYKVLEVGSRGTFSEAELNRLGNEGWELCVVSSSNSAIFKRPKMNLPPRRGGGAGAGAETDTGGTGGFGGGFGTGFGGFGGDFGRASGGAPAGLGGLPGPGVPGGAPTGSGLGAPNIPGSPGALPGATRTQQETQVIPVNHAEAVELARLLKELFAQTPRLSLVADANTNSIVLSGDLSTLQAIKALVDRLDVESRVPPKR